MNQGVFVYDRLTQRTEQASVTSSGEEYGGPVGGTWGAVSANGRIVAFANESGPATQVYAHDMLTGATELVSQPVRGQTIADAAESIDTSLDQSGRLVALASNAANLVRGDTNKAFDVFVRDRGDYLGVGRLGSPSIGVAGDPTFAATDTLFVRDSASDVGSAESELGANLVGAGLVARPRLADLFVRLELASMPSFHGIPAPTTTGLLYGVRFTVRGVRYEARVQRIPGPSYDAAGGASFGLFRRDVDGAWTQVATLRGGFGTTGEEVVVTVPLRDIGLGTREGRLSHVSAFTALGAFAAGATHVLDRLKFES